MANHDYEFVTTEVRDQVFLIGLNRPKKMNGMNLQMMKDLAAAYGEFEDASDVRVGLVFAHGDHFCAGLELDDCAETLMSPLSDGFIPEGGRDPWGILTPRPSRPVVACVNGVCLTVGIELCLASDIVVASTSSRFQQLDISRGIYPFGGATIRWPLACGYQNAMKYLLTGDSLDVEEAHRIGLVQDVVEPGQVFDHAMAIALRIAAHAPRGVEATLRTARRMQDHGQAVGADALYPQIRSIYPTEDAQVGIKTFLDKERPIFSGQ
ncbi:MAG: crotonase/enoyl-CoA hydratase family protein [Pseudomonadota bacterium]